MKKELKICMPVYKLVYASIFTVLLSLVRGIMDTTEIGIALEPYMALLAIVFCADTYEMEYRGGRWEIFRLYPVKIRALAVRRRLIIQTAAICALAYAGYGLFYLQTPANYTQQSPILQYAVYLFAVTVTILFWGILSQTLVNLFRSLWAGMGASVLLWLLLYSKAGENLLGNWNVFSYTFRETENAGDPGWLCGKAVSIAAAALLYVLIPALLKKEDITLPASPGGLERL